MLAEDTCACRTGPEASSPGVPRRPPAPAFPVKKPSAAHPRQPPSRAKPVIAPHSVPQAGWTLPAARPPRPIPLRPPPHASLQSTHGDPGPRAAAAEGTSGPGRPAGAERQAKGRGSRRAGEVALPRLSVPFRARWATLHMLGRGHCGHVSRLRPTAVQAEPGRVPARGMPACARVRSDR